MFGTPDAVAGLHQCGPFRIITMTRRTIATCLNFVLPGAGLWYLSHPAVGFVNLLIAIAAPAIGLVLFPEHAHYALLAVAAGSAGFAHTFSTHKTKKENREAANDSSLVPR